MLLKFTKMQGLGNDFVVIDATQTPIALPPDTLRHIADRRFGIGCDQILVVESPLDDSHDFRYRIFNADGSEVENCGNGARCFVRFVRQQQLTPKREIRVLTLGGLIAPRDNEDGTVTVNMGAPRFEPCDIPFIAPQREPFYSLELPGATREIVALSMGNPHAVQRVANVELAPVAEEGPQIENHPRFPKRVNAGFMEVVDRSHIKLRVFERGAGETLACGTGACAAVVTGISRGWLDNSVEVSTRGGLLQIQWAGEGQPVMMTGEAVAVFTGQMEIP
jgi:diaminopimelate epimerase